MKTRPSEDAPSKMLYSLSCKRMHRPASSCPPRNTARPCTGLSKLRHSTERHGEVEDTFTLLQAGHEGRGNSVHKAFDSSKAGSAMQNSGHSLGLQAVDALL